MNCSRSKRVSIRSKFVLLGFALLLPLALLEIGLRLFSDDGVSLLIKDLELGYRYRRNFSKTIHMAESGENVSLRFNRFGFRGPDWESSRRPGVARIAVLGDSFVAAMAVNESDTAAARLQDRLNRESGSRQVEVLNFGVSGASTAQSLITWRSVVSSLQPDVVLLCFYNGNDLSDNHPQLSSALRPYLRLNEAGELTRHPDPSWRWRWGQWLAEHSHLYVWQRSKMQGLRDRLRSATNTVPPGLRCFDTHPPDPYPEAWRLTEALIGALAREVVDQGARFVLVAVPSHEQVIPEAWQALLDRLSAEEKARYRSDEPDRRLRELADRLGIEFVSLLPVFQRSAKQLPLFFENRGHWNEAGNDLAAAEMARALNANALSPRELVPRDPSPSGPAGLGRESPTAQKPKGKPPDSKPTPAARPAAASSASAN